MPNAPLSLSLARKIRAIPEGEALLRFALLAARLVPKYWYRKGEPNGCWENEEKGVESATDRINHVRLNPTSRLISRWRSALQEAMVIWESQTDVVEQCVVAPVETGVHQIGALLMTPPQPRSSSTYVTSSGEVRPTEELYSNPASRYFMEMLCIVMQAPEVSSKLANTVAAHNQPYPPRNLVPNPEFPPEEPPQVQPKARPQLPEAEPESPRHPPVKNLIVVQPPTPALPPTPSTVVSIPMSDRNKIDMIVKEWVLAHIPPGYSRERYFEVCWGRVYTRYNQERGCNIYNLKDVRSKKITKLEAIDRMEGGMALALSIAEKFYPPSDDLKRILNGSQVEENNSKVASLEEIDETIKVQTSTTKR